MKIALDEAKKAALSGEVPIGAAIFYKEKLICSAHNLTKSMCDPCAHAEILAIKKACKIIGSERLTGATMYVTLEPCPMCAGAIIASRIDSLYFGAYDTLYGAAGGKIDLFREGLGAFPKNIYGGILEAECSKILKDFFENKREEKL